MAADHLSIWDVRYSELLDRLAAKDPRLCGAPRLRPLRDLVYVLQDPLPEKDSAGRFYLPDSTKKHIQVRSGTVLAVGPGRLVCFEMDWPPVKPFDFTAPGVLEAWWRDDAHVMITRRLPLSVKVGDRVSFPDFWGTCVGLETDPSLLIGPASGEEGLLAVMEC
jgi:co-chaperonin GroES (HSP10)